MMPCQQWLIRRLICQGHEVHVFAAWQEREPGHWQLPGAAIHSDLRQPRSLWQSRQVLREHRKAPFDVLHAFSASPGLAGAIVSRLTSVPLVLSLIGGELIWDSAIRYGLLGSVRGRTMLRVAARAASTIIAESGTMRKEALELGIEVRVVPFGVELEEWPTPPPRRRASDAPIRLLHVANLNRVKDQPTLLRAAAILLERGLPFRLDIIGMDTLDGEIQRSATALGLGGCVTFHPPLPHSELGPYFQATDLLVISSIHEGGPVVVLEAAAAGVPTVGTTVGHIADLAPDAAAAVEVRSPTDLASALEALACDEPRRLKLAAAAQGFALRHDAAWTANALAQIYRSGIRRTLDAF